MTHQKWCIVQLGVKELDSFTVDGIKYKVDGKHVYINADEQERKIAKILSEDFKAEVFIVPVILVPENISTPDFLINNKRYDLKTLFGSSKNLLYNRIHKSKGQSNNFVFDISNVKDLSIEDIMLQAEQIYKHKSTSFVDEIILIKDDTIIKKYKK